MLKMWIMPAFLHRLHQTFKRKYCLLQMKPFCVLSDLIEDYGTLVTDHSMKALIGLFYLLSPVRPHRLSLKLFQNLCIDCDIDSPTSSLKLRRQPGYYADTSIAANLPINAVGSSR
jgi:hypothetical protein